MDMQGYTELGVKTAISERIIDLRTNIMKMNQKEFAEFVGLTQPALSQYESGKMLPSITTALNIATKCKVSVDWLCGRDEICINNMADIMSVFFQLYEVNEFRIQTELHKVDVESDDFEDEDERCWIGLKLFYNDNWFQDYRQYKYCNEIATIIEKAFLLNREWNDYAFKKQWYDEEKQRWIESYKDLVVTKDNDRSNISQEEWMELRRKAFDTINERNKKEYEKYMKEHKARMEKRRKKEKSKEEN